MKKLFVLAALLTAGAYSAQAQTTTTTRQTTTTPATSTDTYQTPQNQGQTTTTTESTTTSNNDQSMTVPARTKNGKTMIQPADGAKVKSNGKRVKIK